MTPENTLHTLEKSVADNVASERVGVHITGGLDSSVIASILKQVPGIEVCGFSWLDQNDQSPHRDRVNQVGDFLKIPVHFCPSSLDDFLQVLSADSSILPFEATVLHELPVMRKARDLRVRQIFSGWGGDQGFTYSGRVIFNEYLIKGRWGCFSRECQAIGKSPLRKALACLKGLIPRLVRAPKRAWQHDQGLKINWGSPTVRVHQRRKLSHPGIELRKRSWGAWGRRFGISYQYPMLAPAVLKSVLSLPAHCFYKEGVGRRLPRTLFQNRLPSSIIENQDKSEPRRFEASTRLAKETFKRLLPHLHSVPAEQKEELHWEQFLQFLDEVSQSPRKQMAVGKELRELARLNWVIDENSSALLDKEAQA